MSKTNGIVSSKIYVKEDDFEFEIVNFPFFDGDVPRSTLIQLGYHATICMPGCKHNHDYSYGFIFNCRILGQASDS